MLDQHFEVLKVILEFFVSLDKKNIQSTLKRYFSYFITYEIHPGAYTIKTISEAVFTKRDDDRSVQIECDDISMKTKFVLTPCGLIFGTLRFDEKSFHTFFLRCTPYCA